MKKVIIILFLSIFILLSISSEDFDIEKVFDRVDQLLRKNKIDNAVLELENAVKLTNDNDDLSQIYGSLGFLYENLKNYDKAEINYKLSVKHDNTKLSYLEKLALLIIHKNRDIKPGLEYLLQADKINSNNYLIYYYLLTYYSVNNENEKAILYLNKAVTFLNADKNTFNKYLDTLSSNQSYSSIKNEKLYMNIMNNQNILLNGIIYFYNAAYYQNNKDYKNALQSYQYAVKCFETVDSSLIWLATAYEKYGALLFNLNRYKEAIASYKLAYKINLKIQGEQDIDTIFNNTDLAIVYRAAGDYKEALKILTSSLDLIKNIYGEKGPVTADIYDKIGLVYNDIRDYQKALKFCSLAHDIYKSKGKYYKNKLASSYNSLGVIYRNMGKLRLAVENYKTALLIQKEILDKYDYMIGITYDNLGLLYSDMSDFDTSLFYHFEAIEIFKKSLGENSPETALAYNNLGYVYTNIGDYKQALEYFQKAMSIFMKIHGNEHAYTLTCYTNIGYIYEKLNKYDDAFKYYFDALDYKIKLYGKQNLITAESYNNIGNLYRETGDYNKALLYFQKAEKIYEKNNDLNVSAIYNNIASIYFEKNKIKEAVEYLNKSIDFNKKIYNNENHHSAECYKNLGIIYYYTKNYKKAKESFLNSINIIEKIRKNLDLNKDAKSLFFETQLDSYHGLINNLYYLNQHEESFYYSESIKSRSLLDELSLNAILKNSEIEDEYIQKLNDIKNQINALNKTIIIEKQDNKTADENKILISQLNKQYDETIKEIYKKHPKIKEMTQVKILSLKEVQKKMNNNEIIIEYTINKYKSKINGYVFIIKKDSNKMIKLDEEKILFFNNDIEIFRDIISEPKGIYFYDEKTGIIYPDKPDKIKYKIINNDEALKIVNNRLYDVFIKPVIKDVNPDSNIIIIPDRELAYLPFEALKDTNNRYLIEILNISYNNSATLLMKSRELKISSQKPILCFGGAVYNINNPGNDIKNMKKNREIESYKNQYDYLSSKNKDLNIIYEERGYSWKNLPGTENEVKIIGEIFYKDKNDIQDNIFLGLNVSEKNIKEMNKNNFLNNYKIIHFAAHGHLDNEIPEMSSIVLSQVDKKEEDGYLTLVEILNLNLNCELVTLSACETGLGKLIAGEGVTGLAQSFITAGTKNICMTLWSIADESTKEFMISYYKKIVKGSSYKKALAETKKEFIKNKKWSQPYFWAPFVIYGE